MIVNCGIKKKDVFQVRSEVSSLKSKFVAKLAIKKNKEVLQYFKGALRRWGVGKIR
jgi:hypothetical protein